MKRPVELTAKGKKLAAFSKQRHKLLMEFLVRIGVPKNAAEVDVDKLPKHPGRLGSMKPGQWYFLPAGQFEPHHGKKFSIPLMIRASDLQ